MYASSPHYSLCLQAPKRGTFGNTAAPFDLKTVGLLCSLDVRAVVADCLMLLCS